MFASVRAVRDGLKQMIGRLDLSRLDGEEAAELVGVLTEIERVAAAARTLAAARVAQTNRWQRGGHRTAASWLAATAGVPVGQAVAVLETAEHLQTAPGIKQAFSDGSLSEAQTKEIAAAVAADPDAEQLLLDAAQQRSLIGLREECRRVRAAAHPDEKSRYQALHDGRYLRHWVEGDGAVRISARLAPIAGAATIAAIQGCAGRLRDTASRQGRREPFEAHAADALVELARGGSGRRAGPAATVHVIVDHAALVRGRATDEETCDMPGVGPIPVSAARAMLADSILKILVVDGVDIKAVAHAGRTIPARVRTALEVRDPECVVPGCDERKDLEIDHWRIDHALGVPATLDDLARLCPWHHYLRTYCGYQLSGGPAGWGWITPDEAEGMPGDHARPPPAA